MSRKIEQFCSLLSSGKPYVLVEVKNIQTNKPKDRCYENCIEYILEKKKGQLIIGWIIVEVDGDIELYHHAVVGFRNSTRGIRYNYRYENVTPGFSSIKSENSYFLIDSSFYLRLLATSLYNVEELTKIGNDLEELNRLEIGSEAYTKLINNHQREYVTLLTYSFKTICTFDSYIDSIFDIDSNVVIDRWRTYKHLHRYNLINDYTQDKIWAWHTSQYREGKHYYKTFQIK